MSNPLEDLCKALKKVLNYLKPKDRAISLIILTGKIGQGKTTLLRQSNLTHYPLTHQDSANLFYNPHGIIIELGELWLNQSDHLLTYTLKQINQCNRYVKISGLMLCVDSSELLLADPVIQLERCKAHARLLERFGLSLGYRIDTSILLTKLDALAGFSEFFQTEHPHDLIKPLGFSLDILQEKKQFVEHFRQKFDQMVEVLGQQIINKLHPARSTVKRTLIREFPLQLTSLRFPIQSLIQNLSNSLFQISTIYFTCAEQGGVKINKLNKKIHEEYALTILDQTPQSNNYRTYFIEGAIRSFQKQTRLYPKKMSTFQKVSAGLVFSVLSLSLFWIVDFYYRTASSLDAVSKDLLAYENLLEQKEAKVKAFYYLSQAASKLHQTSPNLLSPLVDQFSQQLTHTVKHHLQNEFLPNLLSEIEQKILDSTQSPQARYQSLKIYLMLGDRSHYSHETVSDWFKKNLSAHYSQSELTKQITLIQQSLKLPLQPVTVNKQLVIDTRNYLNALPSSYLYYVLAKDFFSNTVHQINIKGFELGSSTLPHYYSKKGFEETVKTIPSLAAQFQAENWVLERQDLKQLPKQLEEAYCLDYATWWQNFIRKTKPSHYQNYLQAQQITQTLHTAMNQLVQLIQENTGFESQETSFFNQKIANKFSQLNLIGPSLLNELSQNIQEFQKFLVTLNLIDDQGQTIFQLTKSRFEKTIPSDPLSRLYQKTHQLPEPLAAWTKQIADDAWFLFINESKSFLNKQWQKLVYLPYHSKIENRYPISRDSNGNEVQLDEFDQFFAPQGTLNNYVNLYLKPFLDRTSPQWKPKQIDEYMMPISNEIINELIRANVITTMFFSPNEKQSKISFTLQKLNLDPVIAKFNLTIGKTNLIDNQNSLSQVQFNWPMSDAQLKLNLIEGKQFELDEKGVWAFFKMLQKVNVLVDGEDSASLQVIFNINGNSGKYLLKTENSINPFSPGILTGFNLKKELIG